MPASLTPSAAQALLSPSARVLLASARPDPATIGALPWADVHWPTLVSLMAYERAEGPVYRLMLAAPYGVVPDDVLVAAQGLDRVARFRAAELSDAAASACDVLHGAGITALWLKGAALAMQSPAGFAVRNMGDLDLLVAPSEIEQARQALARAGWSSGLGAGYDAHHHEAPMLRPGGLRLELHSGLFPPGHPFAADSASTWLARGEMVHWGTRPVLVLPKVWHVVHASAHWAWSHEGTVGTWQYLHDVARLTEGWSADGPEWASVVQSAELIWAAMPVGWATWTASRLGGSAVSEAVVGRLRGAAGPLGGLAERQWVLAALHSPAGSPSVRWSRFWWRQAMRGLGDDGGRWPWAAGRGAALASPETPATVVPGGVVARVQRWQRHLGRMLRG
ncbi:MAG: nucleotidyltransferase family protein [Gemmatimonadota bacterium]